MSNLMQWLWQFNLELSLLLIFILLARSALRKLAKVYNNYLLWFSIPLALVVSNWITSVEFSALLGLKGPPVQTTFQRYAEFHSALVPPEDRFDAWLIGGVIATVLMVLLLLRLVLQHWNLRRELSLISSGKEVSISSSFPVLEVVKDGFSPAVYGFIKPNIYFPKGLSTSLSSQQLELIIRHEEQHVRQGHLWLNLFWDVLVCFLWFNPLVYLARQAFRHDQELYCDYLVLKNSDPHGRRSYGHALLSTVSATHSVSLLCSWKMFNQLEERIMNIKSTFNTPKKLLLALFAMLLVCCTSAYSLAMDKGADQRDDKVNLIVNNDAKKKIKVVASNELTYINDDGEHYIVDNGEHREMTNEERSEYESLIEGIGIGQAVELDLDGTLTDGHRVIAIRSTDSDQDRVVLSQMVQSLEGLKGLADLKSLENLKGLEGLKSLEGLKALEELEALHGFDIDVSPLAKAEHELAKTLSSIEQARENENANTAQLDESAKELKKIQKQLAKDQARVRKTREKARLAAKSAREQLREAH